MKKGLDTILIIWLGLTLIFMGVAFNKDVAITKTTNFNIRCDEAIEITPHVHLINCYTDAETIYNLYPFDISWRQDK